LSIKDEQMFSEAAYTFSYMCRIADYYPYQNTYSDTTTSSGSSNGKYSDCRNQNVIGGNSVILSMRNCVATDNGCSNDDKNVLATQLFCSSPSAQVYIHDNYNSQKLSCGFYTAADYNSACTSPADGSTVFVTKKRDIVCSGNPPSDAKISGPNNNIIVFQAGSGISNSYSSDPLTPIDVNSLENFSIVTADNYPLGTKDNPVNPQDQNPRLRFEINTKKPYQSDLYFTYKSTASPTEISAKIGSQDNAINYLANNPYDILVTFIIPQKYFSNFNITVYNITKSKTFQKNYVLFDFGPLYAQISGAKNADEINKDLGGKDAEYLKTFYALGRKEELSFLQQMQSLCNPGSSVDDLKTPFGSIYYQIEHNIVGPSDYAASHFSAGFLELMNNNGAMCGLKEGGNVKFLSNDKVVLFGVN